MCRVHGALCHWVFAFRPALGVSHFSIGIYASRNRRPPALLKAGFSVAMCVPAYICTFIYMYIQGPGGSGNLVWWTSKRHKEEKC